MDQYKYMKIHIELDTIYIVEEMYGIELDKEKLNNITKSTYVNFFQFFNDRYRKLPIVVKNDNKYLTVIKSLIQDKEPIKAELTKLPNNYMMINMTHKVDRMGLVISDNSRVVHDLRKVFESI